MKKLCAMRFLLVVTLSLVQPCCAKHCCTFKIDAINRQALSLKDHCDSIKEFVDCIATNCCGGGSDCACAPTAITASTETIDTPGSYCLSEDVFSTITVNTDEGVFIDLNGHTVSSLLLSNNCSVKNGTVYGLGVGSNTLVSNVRVYGVTGNGAGSSVVLVDSSRLTSLQNVERVVMARCTGDGTSVFQIFAGVKEVTLYDSVFSFLKIKKVASQFERLALYRSMIKSNLEFEYDTENPDFTYPLKELSFYQSIIGDEVQLWGLVPSMEHFLIEESQIGRIAMYVLSSDPDILPQNVNALFARSVFKDGIAVQKFDGLVVQKCQLGGYFSLGTLNNVHIDNVSVTNNNSAISVGAGKNILLTDCCVTQTTDGYAGYTTSSFPENLNLIRCYAQGCYQGFDLSSAASCLVKNCVSVGAQNVGFSGNSTTTRAVGNLALRVGGVLANNFSPSFGEGAPFDIDVTTTFMTSSVSDAQNTLERSAWRNLSFEFNSPVPPPAA